MMRASFTFGLLVFFAAPAAAQVNMPLMTTFPQNFYVPNVWEQQRMRGDYSDGDVTVGNVRQDDSNQSINDAYSLLTYRTSGAVRKKNIDQFVTNLAKTDPAGAREAATLFPQALPQIEKMLPSMGLAANNVADAYTVWWIAAWSAVNKQPLSPNSDIFSSVKPQAARAILSSPQMRSANNSQKQELAEFLLIQAAMIDGHIDAAAGNPSQQAALAKAVNQGAKKMGLDLTTMDLTENGFVPRSGKRSDASDADPAAPDGAETQMAANDNAGASETDNGKLVLYGVGGVALLAGMFALGKSFGNKG